jgi:HAMP domain-containing protein
MQYLGFFLVVLAIIGILVGVMQQLKAKKILAAPFKKTGEVAQNPNAGDAKGTVSCEGAVQVQQPIYAPCSGKPCLYFEVEVTRLWEKQVQTENGLKTEKGTSNISTNKTGSQFWLNDGSGPVGINAVEDVDTDLEKAFEQTQNVAWGDVVFGNFRVHVPATGGNERTTGVRATEKILPAQGNLFAMGKLAGGTIMKTDGMLGKLLLSPKGRDKLVGATKRNSLIGFVVGGLMFLPGGYFSIFGEPPVDDCANMQDAIATMCTGKITNESGNTYDWTVTAPGTYTIQVIQPGVKIPIIPSLAVKDASGKDLTGGVSELDKFTQKFDAGKYTINVRNSIPGETDHIQGGFSFSLNITGGPAGGAAAPAGSAAGAAGSAKAPAKAPAAPAGKPGTTAKPAGSGKGW